MTVANLGFAIDSSPLANASSVLDKLSSSAAKAEQAASRVSGAGTRMSRGFADLNPSLEKIVGSLGRLEGIATSIDKRLDAMAIAASRAAKGNTVLERSAIEASTAYKALEASLAAVTASQLKADAAQAKSLAQIQKQKDAIASLNAELQKLRNAPLPGNPGQSSPAQPANNNFAATNAMFQFQDIAMTAAGGMSPAMIALQQGSQLSGAFAGMTMKQAGSTMVSALGALVSPLSLVTVGLTAASAAAIQWGIGLLGAEDKTKKFDDALEKHDGVLKRLEDRYGSLVEKAKGFSAEGAGILRFASGSDARSLKIAGKAAGQDLFDQSNISFWTMMTDPTSMVSIGAFQDAIVRLQNETRAGKPDFDKFYSTMESIASIDPRFAKKADDLSMYADRFRLATKAAEELERVQKAVFDDIGPNKMLLSQGTTNRADMDKYILYESRNAVTARRSQQAFDADILSINARSPQERAEAARRSAASRYDENENAPQRRMRIDQAGALALAQAQRQLSEAQRERALSLDKIVADQQLEIDLIGKTGNAASALRREYDLISQLRMEAARNGTKVDEDEIKRIQQKVAEEKKLADIRSQRQFDFELNRQASDARLSSRDRQIVTTLRSYGLPEDLGGANAARIGQQIDWEETKSIAKSFFSEMQQAAFENGGNIGDAIVQAALNAANKALSKAVDNLFDKLANGVADWLIGGGSSGSGTGSALGSIASVAFSGKAANDNTSAGASSVGAYAAAIKSIESAGSGGYSALGPITKSGDRAYGAYQVMGANIGPWSQQALGRSVSVDEFMANPSIQDKVFQSKFGSYVNSYGPAGAAQAWFGGPGSVGKGSSWTDQLGTSGTEYVDKFTKAVGGATDNLASFGGGLDKMGQSLLNAFPSAPAAATGGVGLSGILGNLFGNLTNGPGSQWARAQSGAITGLFAKGTNYAPGGLAIVGEDGPEIVNLPQGSQVFNTNKSAQMMSAANQNGSASAAMGQSVVRISLSPELIGQILSEAQGQTIDIVKENNKGQAELYMNGQSR